MPRRGKADASTYCVRTPLTFGKRLPSGPAADGRGCGCRFWQTLPLRRRLGRSAMAAANGIPTPPPASLNL